jgi:hypothetical protein
VFQRGKVAIYGRDELLQTRNRYLKVYASYPITVLESKHYSFFLFCGEIVVFVAVKNN